MNDIERWRPSGVVILLLGVLLAGAILGLPWSWGGVKNVEGSGALIHGFVNSAIQVGRGGDPEAAARLALELGVAPEISEASLRHIVAKIVQRAEDGDPEAARVALEIALRQRAEE